MTSDTAVNADRQRPETSSDISDLAEGGSTAGGRRARGGLPTAVPTQFAELFVGYATAVSAPGGPLDGDTVRAYLSRVRQYLAWLAAGAVDGDPLTSASARDGAVRDYRTHLLTVAKRKLSTVNAHLTAIDDLYRHLGLETVRIWGRSSTREGSAVRRARPGRRGG